MTHIEGTHLTVAAMADQEVAVVMHYDNIRVTHITMTPDEARAHAADIIAAAGRAENPRATRIIRTEPDYREGPEWYNRHDERL